PVPPSPRSPHPCTSRCPCLRPVPGAPRRRGVRVMTTVAPERDRPALDGARPRLLHVVGEEPSIDLAAAERAVGDLLVALGQDAGSEHLCDTPRRVALAYAELLTPVPFDLTTFPND